jgi:hypothetical protein
MGNDALAPGVFDKRWFVEVHVTTSYSFWKMNSAKIGNRSVSPPADLLREKNLEIFNLARLGLSRATPIVNFL